MIHLSAYLFDAGAFVDGVFVEGVFVDGEVNISPRLRMGCSGTDRIFGMNPGM